MNFFSRPLLLCHAALHAAMAAKSKPTPDDFLVKGLQEVVPAFASFRGDMYAGVLPVDPLDGPIDDNNGGHLMFWHFARENPTVKDTIVVWFNGGPGCSVRLSSSSSFFLDFLL